MKTAPGPYTFDGFGINAGDEYKSRIATITPARFWPTSPEEAEESRTATANLLTAAHELLATMKNLFEQCAMVHKYGGAIDNTRAADEAIKAAKQAIDKAEGRN